MATFWNNLNFSGKAVPGGEGESVYNPVFQKASSNIELLRAVARAGREETKRLEEALDGRPKVVLGQPERSPLEVDSAIKVGSSSPETRGAMPASSASKLAEDFAEVSPPSSSESLQSDIKPDSGPDGRTGGSDVEQKDMP